MGDTDSLSLVGFDMALRDAVPEEVRGMMHMDGSISLHTAHVGVNERGDTLR